MGKREGRGNREKRREAKEKNEFLFFSANGHFFPVIFSSLFFLQTQKKKDNKPGLTASEQFPREKVKEKPGPARFWLTTKKKR